MQGHGPFDFEKEEAGMIDTPEKREDEVRSSIVFPEQKRTIVFTSKEDRDFVSSWIERLKDENKNLKEKHLRDLLINHADKSTIAKQAKVIEAVKNVCLKAKSMPYPNVVSGPEILLTINAEGK